MSDRLTLIAPTKEQFILHGVKAAAQNPKLFAEWAMSNKLPAYPVVGTVLRTLLVAESLTPLKLGERRTAVWEGWTAILEA